MLPRAGTHLSPWPRPPTAALHCLCWHPRWARPRVCSFRERAWSCCSAQIVPPAPKAAASASTPRVWTAEQLRANLELLKAEAKQLRKIVSAAKKAEAQLVGEPLIVLHMPCRARPLSHHTQIEKRGSF